MWFYGSSIPEAGSSEASSSYGREEFPASWRNWKLPG